MTSINIYPILISEVLILMLSNIPISNERILIHHDYCPSINNQNIIYLMNDSHYSNNPISTRVEIINIEPKDNDGDRKYDFYSTEIDEWIFHFKIVIDNPIEEKNILVNVGYVWINLSYNEYRNNSMVYLNSIGEIYLEFNAFPLNSSDGKKWTENYNNNWNMNITVEYPGFELYLPCSLRIYGTLHSHGDDWYNDYEEDRNINYLPLVIFLVGIQIIISIMIIRSIIRKKKSE